MMSCFHLRRARGHILNILTGRFVRRRHIYVDVNLASMYSNWMFGLCSNEKHNRASICYLSTIYI